MKTSELKNLIKEAVREAIKEELKEILLEAIKSPKSQINEHMIPQVNLSSSSPQTMIDKRRAYQDVINQTSLNFSSKDISQPFIPTQTDPINGALPSGELSMDQIMNLMK
jgi:hypothetical protein